LSSAVTPLSVVHIASGDRWAGAEAQLYTLATHLAKDPGITVSVILLNEGELAERLRAQQVRVTVFDESRFGFLALLRKITAEIRATRPDIIHTHRQKENILGAIAGWWLHIPSVRTVHGAPEFTPAGFRQLHKHIIAAVDRWLGVHIQQRLIAVSADLATKLEQTFPAAKIVVIENGIDIAATRHAASEPAQIAGSVDNASHIGIAGRLDPVKRLDIFLDMAAKLLAPPGKTLMFHIFGDGKLREVLELQAEQLGISASVNFHGHRQDIGACLAALDVLVMCSDHEGLPMTPLESIAVGTPVVAHGVGGLVDILEGDCGGTFVKAHAAAAYAEAVARILGQDSSDMMRRGIERLEQRYSASGNARLVAEVYESVLAPPA
jgi:L-malate glycosyltransferase